MVAVVHVHGVALKLRCFKEVPIETCSLSWVYVCSPLDVSIHDPCY